MFLCSLATVLPAVEDLKEEVINQEISLSPCFCIVQCGDIRISSSRTNVWVVMDGYRYRLRIPSSTETSCMIGLQMLHRSRVCIIEMKIDRPRTEPSIPDLSAVVELCRTTYFLGSANLGGKVLLAWR